MSAEVDEYDEDEMGSEEGEEGEEGEEEEQGGEEEEEGEMVDFDTEDLYSQPRALASGGTILRARTQQERRW